MVIFEVILPFLLILPHKKWSPKLIDDHDFNILPHLEW